MPFPADVPIGMIDVRDSAAVCVKALTEGGHAGKLYELTGAPVTLTEAAAGVATARPSARPIAVTMYLRTVMPFILPVGTRLRFIIVYFCEAA